MAGPTIQSGRFKLTLMIKIKIIIFCIIIASACLESNVHMKKSRIFSNVKKSAEYFPARFLVQTNHRITVLMNWTEYVPLRSSDTSWSSGLDSMLLAECTSFKRNYSFMVEWKNLTQMNFRMKTPNLTARYTNGNGSQKIKGIKNMHLNIRSLSNKVFEVKRIVDLHKPHILGISECELRKKNNFYDEAKLKVPGYNILFPKSWNIHGFARVIIYVKKSLEYEQLNCIEDDLFQSIWLRGGVKKGKRIFFCHYYREHTSTVGNSISSQKQSLKKFLSQWEVATTLDSSNEANKIHISGDMNLDSLNDKWLNPKYYLFSLSTLVEETCNLNHFYQLVKQPTRVQFDSVKNSTSVSCIDHVYSNARFRCSKVDVLPFGNSDHDLISYV